MAVVNFTRGLLAEDGETVEILEPYLPRLLQILAVRLEQGVASKNLPLIKGVLDSLSTIASALQEKFASCYNVLMPGLKNLLALPATTPQELEARANCIRCIGNCVAAVSDDVTNYKNDALSILNDILTLKNTLDSEDPALLTIHEVLSYFADTLKEEFSGVL